MCRLVAYIGDKIPLENIIVKPDHSLLDQSQVAQEAKLTVNGDGFGIAWYDGLDGPGIYKGTLPAWSDSNLPSICKMVKSGMFIAHVRASTFGAASRENCHPFTFKKWSFAHNGGIAEFGLIRRKVESMLDDEHYNARHGSTDSELFFLLLLTNKLNDDPVAALNKTISQINQIVKANGADTSPIRLTCVLSNGSEIFGLRYASDDKSPTLYLSDCLDHGGRAIASEPLHGNDEKWTTLKPGQIVKLAKTGVDFYPLT